MSAWQDRRRGREAFTVQAGRHAVSVAWTEASQPVAVAVIAHGAGAGMAHPFIAGAAEGLAGDGVSAVRFNFPYMEMHRRLPDPAQVLLDTWQHVLENVRDHAAGLSLIACGKSMGGRIASMMAAKQGEDFSAAALVFFGYPLHAPGKPDRLRDAHLPRIRRPMLFIQGTRDALARLDLVQPLIGRLQPLARLHVIDGGDHSFRVRGEKRPDGEIARALGRVAASYIRGVVSSADAPGP